MGSMLRFSRGNRRQRESLVEYKVGKCFLFIIVDIVAGCGHAFGFFILFKSSYCTRVSVSSKPVESINMLQKSSELVCSCSDKLRNNAADG